MPVDTHHPDFDRNINKWRTVRDCVEGQDAVKSKTTRYLPMSNPTDESDQNIQRYEAYRKRAVFVEVTGRTKNSLVGAIFRKTPTFNLPGELEYLEENADGSGQSLTQVGKQICGELLETGRVGLLVDYPDIEETPTREQERQLNLQANVSIYKAEDIINWRYIKLGGQTILSMVVLREQHPNPDDEYDTIETETKYRVLTLEDGYYTQRLYQKASESDSEDGPNYILERKIDPTKGNGARWEEIPFVIAGAEDNTGSVDDSPLYGLASINIAHYRNSADLEEMLYLHGQGTLFVNPGDMNAEKFKELNPNGIQVGSRSGHILGDGGSANLVQLEATSHIKEAMADKENQMVSIGARLVQPGSGNKTAEQARIEAGAESSVLSTITGNASEATESCLKWAAIFENVEVETDDEDRQISFALNKEFWPATLSVDLKVLLRMVEENVIPREVLFNTLVKLDIIEEDWDWEDVKARLQDDARTAPGMEGLERLEGALGGGEE